jgi:aldose sugar dehydrogenase
MHKNNIKLAVFSIGVVVTLITLGMLVTRNFGLPVLAQITQQNGTNSTITASTPAEPIIINDSNLKAEVFFKGIEFPTSMAFLGPDDILVLEKNNGTVRRIVNGTMLPEPLLDVSVANKSERGMLGIAVSKNENKTNVFLYYTESGGKNGNDDCPTPTLCNDGNDPLGNRLYRYDLIDNKLVNPKLLLGLPAKPGPAHNGGKIVIGPDSNLYLAIGELTLMKTQASNYQTGLAPDGRGGILRVSQDGQAVGGERVFPFYY